MFISSYTSIYFFIKKFIFSNFYILYMFFGWERYIHVNVHKTTGIQKLHFVLLNLMQRFLKKSFGEGWLKQKLGFLYQSQYLLNLLSAEAIVMK